MSMTNVPAGHPTARKVYSAALFAQTQRRPSFANRLTGAAPQQAAAQQKLRSQTSKDMPVVSVTDLTKGAGDTITVDLYHTTGGKPIMGDRNAEGKGQSLSSSTQEFKINLSTHVIDAGGKMSQKRTVHKLRGIALANLANFFLRLKDQTTLVHLAGARGSQAGTDWVVPLATDPDFAEIMINTVMAPTFNRHFVAKALNLVQGGKELEAITSSDVLALEHIDALSTLMSEAEFKLQPIKIEDDPAANDEPMYCLYVSYASWNALQNKTSGQNWRTFIQNAINRASWGSKHPLFKGEAGMWGNILVKRMERNIRFNASDPFNYVSQANRLTATETTSAVNASLGSAHTVDRCLLLGGQALAHVYGESERGGTYSNWKERKYNFGRALEVMGDIMNGCGKLRFDYKNEQGQLEPTDHGVLAFDVAAPKVSTVTTA